MKAILPVLIAVELLAMNAQAKDCTPVFTENSRSIRHVIYHAGGSFDETVSFESQTLRSVPGPGTKDTETHERKLEAAQLATLKAAFSSLCLKKTPPNGAAPPGGTFFYDIEDKDGSKRRLAYDSGEDSPDFYPLSPDEAKKLGTAWPARVKTPPPPSPKAGGHSTPSSPPRSK